MNNPLLNYSIAGQGETLIVIHGLFGSSRNWQSLTKKFAAHFQVISLDLRNHGDSFHDNEMNYSVMADDVIRLMDELDLMKVNLLGHSMGGKVAMTICHQIPNRIRQLVVADIAPVAYRHDYDELIEPILALKLGSLHSRKEVDEQLSDSIADARVRMFLMQNLSNHSGQLSWKLNWPVLKKSMTNIIGFESIDSWNIQIPSLFIRGALSSYLSDENWALVQSHFKDSSLVTLDKAGHWLHAEQPQVFYDEVMAFLASK